MGMPSCGRRLLRWQQMTLWFKLCVIAVDGHAATISKSFITVDHFPVMYCNLRYFTY